MINALYDYISFLQACIKSVYRYSVIPVIMLILFVFCLVFKDFTSEQVYVKPTNGWKAYYAATRAIVNINNEFFKIVKERSVSAMSEFWLNADYVKCFHATGETLSGYVAF